MKFFPKNAKTKKYVKKARKTAVKNEPVLEPTNLTEGFDFRTEFEILAPKMYKRLSPENSKKLWLVTSSIILKNIGSSQDLKNQLKTAIEQAHKILFK